MTAPLSGPLSTFGLAIPVNAAPMSGGPSTPAMVRAASRAGALGFLAAGYKTPDALGSEISAVHAASIPFGINVFAPNPVPVEPAAYRRYRAARSGPIRNRFGPDPIEDDDYFDARGRSRQPWSYPSSPPAAWPPPTTFPRSFMPVRRRSWSAPFCCGPTKAGHRALIRWTPERLHRHLPSTSPAGLPRNPPLDQSAAQSGGLNNQRVAWDV